MKISWMSQRPFLWLGVAMCWLVFQNCSNGCGCEPNISCTVKRPSPEVEFTYISPTPPSSTSLPTGIPLNGAANVPLSIVITGTSTDPFSLTLDRGAFTMTVSDGTSDIPGDIEFPDAAGSSSVLFIPSRILDPDRTYTITTTVPTAAYSTTLSFTTVASIGGNPAAVPGQGYALKVPYGGMTQPPEIGSVFESFFDDLSLVLTTTDKQRVATSPHEVGFLQVLGGEGNFSQTALSPGSLVFPLSGDYLGPYFHVDGPLTIIGSGITLAIDHFAVYGTLADLTAYGVPGIGITDGTLFISAPCNSLPAFFQDMKYLFCTDTGLLIGVGSFYATPFPVSPAVDINNVPLTAQMTTPLDGSSGVPTTTTLTADIFTTTSFPACIDGNSTSVSVTVRDRTTSALVSGASFTTIGSMPAGCSPTGYGVIVGAGFTPASSLSAGHEYKALTTLDLSPVAGSVFTTQ